jgi:hypothetical protein
MKTELAVQECLLETSDELAAKDARSTWMERKNRERDFIQRV